MPYVDYVCNQPECSSRIGFGQPDDLLWFDTGKHNIDRQYRKHPVAIVTRQCNLDEHRRCNGCYADYATIDGIDCDYLL